MNKQEKNRPYFPCETGIFVLGTQHLSDGALGLYWRLCIHQWDNGRLPADNAALRRISGSPEKFDEHWAEIEDKFQVRKDGPFVASVERIRKRVTAKIKKLSGDGEKAANRRWQAKRSTRREALSELVCNGLSGNLAEKTLRAIEVAVTIPDLDEIERQVLTLIDEKEATD